MKRKKNEEKNDAVKLNRIICREGGKNGLLGGGCLFNLVL